MKPRASSPNLQNASQEKASTGKSQANTQSFPSKTSKGPDTPARKPSKSPFGLFKRTRSKTLGDGSPSPSEAVAAQLYAPPSPMPMQRKPSTQYESVVPTGSPPKPTSAQMTPAQTPQLSFSSSTTSTIAGSEPSDQFYADFAPDSRPSFSNHPSSSSNGNNTISASGNRDTTLKKSAPASSKNFQAQQNSKMPLNGNSKPLNGAPPSKGAFSRMFGGPAKRKV